MFVVRVQSEHDETMACCYHGPTGATVRFAGLGIRYGPNRVEECPLKEPRQDQRKQGDTGCCDGTVSPTAHRSREESGYNCGTFRRQYRGHAHMFVWGIHNSETTGFTALS